jgi:AcrR family transcriptional regulator
MGRRSTHTPQQLRELILDAAQEIIEVQGIAGLSAREIARRIGYSPGTIYNMFENLDDVVLHIEARVLDALDGRLAAVLNDGDASTRVTRLALAYLAFTHEKPKLWNLLFEHHMPAGTALPSWYQQKLEMLMSRVEAALAPDFGPGQEMERERAARVLWATADKLSVVTTDTASRLIEDLVGTYLSGLARADEPGVGGREASITQLKA